MAGKLIRPVRSAEQIERARVQQAEWEAGRAELRERHLAGERAKEVREWRELEDHKTPHTSPKQRLYAQLDREEAKRAEERRQRILANPPKPEGTMHATTLSAPFGASVRKSGQVGAVYTGGREVNPNARPKVKRRKPNHRNLAPVESTREPISDELRWAVLNRDRHTCRYCGTHNGPFHMDHVIPVAMSGPTTFENLVTACMPCNLRKGAQVWTPNPICA